MQADVQKSVQEYHTKFYELNILITRHGPKDGLGGPLSQEGRESVLQHYQSQLADPTHTENKVISSPINRAFETANIYKHVQDQKHSLNSADVELDERLSEKNLVEFIEQLNDEKKEEWFQEWFVSELGKQAASDFSNWILDQIHNQQIKGGALKINAFSHGPMMAAFVLKLEDLSGEKLIRGNVSETDRLSISRLFTSETSVFGYLSAIEISSKSDSPEKFMIKLQNHFAIIPLSLLKSI